MVSIFISYSHTDRVNAEVLAGKIKDIGYETWIDFKGILGGDDWRKSIEEAVQSSSALIVLMTPESVVSKWVQYECERAKLHQLSVIPLLIRPCTLPAFLKEYQYIDFLRGFDIAFGELQRALLSTVIKQANRPQHLDALPTLPQPTSTQLTPDINQQALASQPISSDVRHVLVVEDTQSYQELIRDIFLEYGVKVDIAHNRSEAAQLLKDVQYDLISLDMQLSTEDVNGESGKFLLKLWKRYQPETPLVIISSLPWNKNQTRDFFKRYAVLDVLDKPVDQEILEELVRQTFGSNRPKGRGESA
jgi:CheY-like chemotaxis protein